MIPHHSLLAALLCLVPCPRTQVSSQESSGLYRAAEGDEVVLFPAPPAPAQTAMLALGTGEVRMLFTGEDGQHSFGPSLAVPEPVQGTVSFERDGDGHVVALLRNDEGAAPRRYARAGVRLEPVTFANGDVTLAGAIVLPEGSGPFPAAVMLHGSEAEPREGNLGMALFFAAEGIAALIFDKRGVGESGGGEWRASFDAYAGDACAAFEALRRNTSIDPERVGFWGHSQGAWVAALAGSRTKAAAFVVLECGGALSPVETTQWWSRRRFEARSALTPVQIEAALCYRKKKFDVLAGTLSLAELEPLTAAARKEPWFRTVTERIPDGPFWEPNVGYDPRPALEGLEHCPVLALYAEHDDSTPTEPSVRAARAAFERSGHARALVCTVPDANHGFFETRTGKLMEDELRSLQRFAPQYPPTLMDWLKEVTRR